jgi:hypothetical protein
METKYKIMLFIWTGRDSVSELRPQRVLLFIPQMIYDIGGQQWNDTHGGKPKKNSEKNLSQCLFVHHKSDMG